MKRLVGIVLLFVLGFSLTACGNVEYSEETTTTTSAVYAIAETETTEELDSLEETTAPATTQESTTEEETTAQKTTTTEKIITTEKTTKTTQKETTTQKPTTTKSTTTVDPDSQATVYRTKSGECYHYENPCGRGTYYEVSLAQAKAAGLRACEKCVLH